MKSMPEVCELCGLPLRYGIVTGVFNASTHRFCCIGCRQVFVMLMEASEASNPASFRGTDLFKRCREMGVIPRSEEDLKHHRTSSQSTAVTQAQSDPASNPNQIADMAEGGETLRLNLRVDGMWCPACAWVIEAALKNRKGVVSAVCNFSTDRVRCRYDPMKTSPDRIIKSIRRLGYNAALPGETVSAIEKKREFVRFAVSAFLTMNVMMLSFSLYSGFFTEFSAETIYKISWPMFFLATAVLSYGGRTIFKKAWSGITAGSYGMETLIVAGASCAYLYSVYNLIRGSIHLYFDTASMLITLVLLGKALERRAKDAVQEDLDSFFALVPTKVRICSDLYPKGRYVAAEHLQEGDVFRSEAGEVVAADGIIVTGQGTLDEASITGEPMAVVKKARDRVRSGTRIIHGRLKIRAEGVGGDSTLGQMIRIMEKALGNKTPLEGQTDRILFWFVPTIIVLALGTGLTCMLLGRSVEVAMIRAVTVMVISCPCALGVAIPLTRVAGISLAGRKGILVRDFAAFEKTEKINAFVFDKTGTITKGRWALQEIHSLKSLAESHLLALAAALEAASEHAIAMAIKRRADEKGIQPVAGKNIQVFENGVSGEFDGKRVKLGAAGFFSTDLVIPAPEKGTESRTPSSQVYMSVDGKMAGVFLFGDAVRETSLATVRNLRDAGHYLALISGDGASTTRAVGREIGIDAAFGGKLPQHKAAFIEDLQQEGHGVAMVGDGVNDAPAMAQADLAMALYSGSHLGKETADITLMRGDPGQIPEFLQLGQTVNRKIHQNLACTFLYNTLCIPIAMSGLLTPLVAVCAMLLSSLSVIGNTLLLIKRTP